MSEIPARSYLKPAQLRLILEIADSGQLRQAAANCAMTQPAASRMLAEVERLFGARCSNASPRACHPPRSAAPSCAAPA